MNRFRNTSVNNPLGWGWWPINALWLARGNSTNYPLSPELVNFHNLQFKVIFKNSNTSTITCGLTCCWQYFIAWSSREEGDSGFSCANSSASPDEDYDQESRYFRTTRWQRCRGFPQGWSDYNQTTTAIRKWCTMLWKRSQSTVCSLYWRKINIYQTRSNVVEGLTKRLVTESFPFANIPKFKMLILLTDCHTLPSMLVVRIWR